MSHDRTFCSRIQIAEKLGLQYHHLPISLDKLDIDQVKELRKILRNSQGPVFVHCRNRTTRMSLTACGVKTDLIFEQARELSFPVQDEKLRLFPKEPLRE